MREGETKTVSSSCATDPSFVADRLGLRGHTKYSSMYLMIIIEMDHISGQRPCCASIQFKVQVLASTALKKIIIMSIKGSGKGFHQKTCKLLLDNWQTKLN